MNAVISARAGKGLLLDGSSLKSFDAADPSRIVSLQKGDLPYLFGEAQDLRIIEDSDVQSITLELKRDCNLNLALDLTLISFDGELLDSIRRDALEELHEILANSSLVVQLENILYARPLPEDGDLVGALDLCGDARVPNAEVLLRRFEKYQPVIGKVSAAWDIIPTRLFGTYENQAEFQQLTIREGLFRSLAMMGSRQSTLLFLIEARLNDRLKHLHNWQEISYQWVSLYLLMGDESEAKREALRVLRSYIAIDNADPENGTPTSGADLSVFPIERVRSLWRGPDAKAASVLNDLTQMPNDHLFRTITDAFDDPSLEVRNEAARALVEVSPDPAGVFTRALREATPERRRRIAGAIASSGLAGEALVNLLGEDRERTYDAFSLLFLMAKAGEVEPLMQALEDHPNIDVRVAVVKLLALSGQPKIVRAFRRLAARGSLPAEVRSAVVEAITSSEGRKSTPSVA